MVKFTRGVYNLLVCNCNELPIKVPTSWNKKMYRERLVLWVIKGEKEQLRWYL